MRQVHRPSEKLFVDYSGKKPRICDATIGEVTDVELFVGVLRASNYTFAEATRSQMVADFCASTVRALEYFGAAPSILVPDQLRSAAKRPDRYDPDINSGRQSVWLSGPGDLAVTSQKSRSAPWRSTRSPRWATGPC